MHPDHSLHARTRTRAIGIGLRHSGPVRAGTGDHARRSGAFLGGCDAYPEPSHPIRRSALLGGRSHPVRRRERRRGHQRPLFHGRDARCDVARRVARHARQGVRRQRCVPRSGGHGRRPGVRSERHPLLHLPSHAEPRAAPPRNRGKRAGIRAARSVQRGRPHLLPTSHRSRNGIRTTPGQHRPRRERLRGASHHQRDAGLVRHPGRRQPLAVRGPPSLRSPARRRPGSHRAPVRSGR